MMKRKSQSKRWQESPEGVLRSWQARKLRQYLSTVVLPFSPYYRKLFQECGLEADGFHTLDDLQRIPFTTKADLLSTPTNANKFKDFIVVPDPRVLARRPGTVLGALCHGRQAVTDQFEAEFRPIFMTFTTGRSAEPTPVFYTQRDLAHLSTSGARIIEVCGTRPEDRVLNAFPFAPHLAFWLTHYAGTAAGVMILSSGGGKVMGTEGTIRHIRRFKPDAIIGMPTFLYHLLHQAAEQGVRCENLRGIVLGG
jgi:phenylacetate-CoA ligase